jgi:hypothetical protein
MPHHLRSRSTCGAAARTAIRLRMAVYAGLVSDREFVYAGRWTWLAFRPGEWTGMARRVVLQRHFDDHRWANRALG